MIEKKFCWIFGHDYGVMSTWDCNYHGILCGRCRHVLVGTDRDSNWARSKRLNLPVWRRIRE